MGVLDIALDGVSAALFSGMRSLWTCSNGKGVHCRKKRRARFATLMLVELVCQWINTAAFVIPNAFLLAKPCDYFNVIVREPRCRPSSMGFSLSACPWCS